MNQLSAVVITYNEEKNIERCLESLKAVADEILVVDSHSTDKTVEIAAGHGARVILQEFLGHVEQKNFAMQQAKYDWVLSLDADEVLDAALSGSIKTAKENLAKGKAYQLNRLTSFCGKWIRHSGWYPDRKIRLWYKQDGAWGGLNPHDTVMLNSGVVVEKLSGTLLHYSFDSINQHIEQIKKFSDIAAQQAMKKGKNAGFIEIGIYPFLFFIKRYIFKLGFLDGFYGFVVCANSAYFKMLKFIKLRHLQLQSKT